MARGCAVVVCRSQAVHCGVSPLAEPGPCDPLCPRQPGGKQSSWPLDCTGSVLLSHSRTGSYWGSWDRHVLALRSELSNWQVVISSYPEQWKRCPFWNKNICSHLSADNYIWGHVMYTFWLDINATCLSSPWPCTRDTPKMHISWECWCRSF